MASQSPDRTAYLRLAVEARFISENRFMQQNELVREVAQATGESVATIRRRGFSPLRLDEESQESPDGPGPQTVDWDALDTRRHSESRKSGDDVLVPA